MMDYMTEIDLPKCKKCGATVPPGKTLCWCCEHDPKLHHDDTATNNNCTDKDACEIHFDKPDD